jgi:hypothetical protein
MSMLGCGRESICLATGCQCRAHSGRNAGYPAPVEAAHENAKRFS